MDELNINDGILPQEAEETVESEAATSSAEESVISEASDTPEVSVLETPVVPENSAEAESPMVAEAPVISVNPDFPDAPEGKKPKKTKAPKEPKAPKEKRSVANIVSTVLIVLIISVGLVALLISVISHVSDVMGYEKALGTYMDVVSNEASDDLGMLVPNEEVKLIVEEENDGKQEHIEFLIDYAVEQEITNDDIKDFEYEIISVEKLESEKCTEIGNDLAEKYGLSSDCVEKAYKIKFEYSFKENRNHHYGNDRCYAVRIDGEWYIVTTSCEFADFSD